MGTGPCANTSLCIHLLVGMMFMKTNSMTARARIFITLVLTRAVVVIRALYFPKVLPYIDGFNHVSRIAGEADVDINLVKSCVQNLVYYGVITLIPIFQYSNVYAATTKLRMLCEDKDLQERCLRYVSKSARELPALRDVFRMYSSMSYGVTVRDLCIRLNPHPLKINERKLILFGVLEGLIRRVYKIPVYLCDDYEDGAHTSGLHKHLTGLSSMDEICCTLGMSNQHLEDYLERDPNVVVIWK